MARSIYLMSSLVFVGCDQRVHSPQAHRLVVLDLDAIARALGRDVAIQQQVEAATRSLNTQLLQAAQEMQKQLDDEKAKLGSKPTDEEHGRLRQLQARANESIRNNKLLAQLRQQEVRKELIQRFRSELKPIAEALAKRWGASAVLVATDELLWFSEADDITDEVIAELRARALASPASKSEGLLIEPKPPRA